MFWKDVSIASFIVYEHITRVILLQLKNSEIKGIRK